MTILDGPLRGVSSQLTNMFGTSVTFRKRGTGTYNTATGVATPNPTSYTVKAVVEAVKLGAVYGMVQVGDRKITIAAKDLAEVPNKDEWDVTIDNKLHRIVSVEPVMSGDLPAIITVWARGNA